MNLIFLFFFTFLNLGYKNIFFYKKIYFFGFEFNFNFLKKKFNFFYIYYFWSKKYFNFLKNKFLYKFILNKKKKYFLFYFNFFKFKLNFIYFFFNKRFYIFIFNLIINVFFIYYNIKKIFYKKIYINYKNSLIIYFYLKKYFLYISYFYNKIYISNIFFLFRTFFDILNLNLLKLHFNIFFFKKKFFYVFFKKKIFKRYLFFILYDFFNIFIPKYIIRVLNINKLLTFSVIDNIFLYFKLLFGLNFFVFNLFFNNFKFIFDYFYYKKYLFVLKNSFFKKNIFIIDNKCGIFFPLFSKFNLITFKKKFFLQFVVYDIFLNYIFYFLCNNDIIYNNLNFFLFNKNIEYLINILNKISFNIVFNSFIFDKVIDFPLKNYLVLYIYKIFIILNIDIFKLSRILNILNFDFIYYKYYYLIFIPYYRSDILTDEDLIDEIYRFFLLNIKVDIFYVEKLKIKNNFNLFFIYKIKYILFYKKINEIFSLSFISDYDSINIINKYCLKILNPISHKMCFMRYSLFFGLIKNFVLNYNNLLNFSYFYEIGKIYYYDTNFFSKTYIRSLKEEYKLSIFYWNISKNNFEFIISFFNDVFYLFKIDYLITSIYYNKYFDKNYFLLSANDRFVGCIFKSNININNKLIDFFIIDFNFVKIKNINNNIYNLIENKFFIRDLNIIYNFKFSFQNFIYLIKKFFSKFNISNILYNICYLNNYNFYKFVCLRLIFFVNLYFNFSYLNYLIFKLINYFNLNNML